MNLLSVISFATFKNSTSAIAAIKDLTDSVFQSMTIPEHFIQLDKYVFVQGLDDFSS
jgi:hypothetical protein